MSQPPTTPTPDGAGTPIGSAINEIIQGLDLASDNAEYAARQKYLREIFTRCGVAWAEEERDGFFEVVSTLAKLATNDDGIDPEAWWIELDPETAQLLRILADRGNEEYDKAGKYKMPFIVEACRNYSSLIALNGELGKSLQVAHSALMEPKRGGPPNSHPHLAAQVAALTIKIEATENEADMLIRERDDAEEACDKLASAVLGEPIDWSDHQGKWAEALEEVGSLAAQNAELRRALGSLLRACAKQNTFNIEAQVPAAMQAGYEALKK